MTQDDGPYKYTPEILDLLTEYDMKATFFVTGVNLGKGAIDDPTYGWDTMIKRMIADGHQIASHTWSHADLTKITKEQRKDEIIKLEMALRNILGDGYIPTYMRPPYSSCTEECRSDLNDLGYVWSPPSFPSFLFPCLWFSPSFISLPSLLRSLLLPC